MVFLADGQSEDVIATIVNGQKTERYSCKISVCNNPVCTCRNVNIHLAQLDVEADRDATPRYVEINFVEKTLSFKDKGELSAEDLQFAQTFLDNLTDDDFKILFGMHFEIKNRITEAAGPDAIDADFDFQEIERNGILSVYSDVLPFGDRLYATIDGKSCLIYDQYCLLPKCSCKETMLDIVTVDETTNAVKSLGAVWVDYGKQDWKPAEDMPLPLALGALQSSIEQQIPDIYGALRKRHARLKEIYASCRKRRRCVNDPLLRPKVGRNDPCPCGSGLKFKKCCLSKQM